MFRYSSFSFLFAVDASVDSLDRISELESLRQFLFNGGYAPRVSAFKNVCKFKRKLHASFLNSTVGDGIYGDTGIYIQE